MSKESCSCVRGRGRYSPLGPIDKMLALFAQVHQASADLTSVVRAMVEWDSDPQGLCPEPSECLDVWIAEYLEDRAAYSG